jgi:hypothetical protein
MVSDGLKRSHWPHCYSLPICFGGVGGVEVVVIYFFGFIPWLGGCSIENLFLLLIVFFRWH